MERSPSKALTKRNPDTALMPPPPPPKRQKRPAKVIDEDVYSDALSHIIARDFFPGLLEADAQREYMEALDSNNRDWIRDAGRKLTQVMTPGHYERTRIGRATTFTPTRNSTSGKTPERFHGETPRRASTNESNEDFSRENPSDVDVNMSLAAFQAKYTSEDNESFNALLDKQNEKRAAKYAFFHHGNKIPSARQIAYRERAQQVLENGSASTALISATASGKSQGSMSKPRPSEDLDARPASVDGFSDSQGPRNNFMFGPEGVEDQKTTIVCQAEQNSKAPLKAVQYSATRFPVPHDGSEDPVPPSPSLSAINAAIAGRPRATISESGYTGAETPRVNGYAFVDAEPTPSELGVPIADEDVDAAEREAAMQLLPQIDENGPSPFSIAERSKREELALKLVEKANASSRKSGRTEQLRNLGITPGRTSTPKFVSSPAVKMGASMTPAARKLAETIGTPKRDKGGFDAVEGSVRRSAKWTPLTQTKKTT